MPQKQVWFLRQVIFPDFSGHISLFPRSYFLLIPRRVLAGMELFEAVAAMTLPPSIQGLISVQPKLQPSALRPPIFPQYTQIHKYTSAQIHRKTTEIKMQIHTYMNAQLRKYTNT